MDAKLNYWPDIDKEESTEVVFDFVKMLNKQLEDKYQKSIKCKLSPVQYDSKASLFASKELSNSMKSLLTPIAGLSELPSAEEKNKKEVSLPSPKEYKFLVFDDYCFFRVFDIKASNYYPLYIKPAEGITINDDYIKVDNQADLERTIYSYLNSQYLKDVIRYMVEEEARKTQSTEKKEKAQKSF